MQPEALKLLEDIRVAAAYILDKTDGKTLSRCDLYERTSHLAGYRSPATTPIACANIDKQREPCDRRGQTRSQAVSRED